MNISDATGQAYQLPIQLSYRPIFASALHGENKTKEILHFYPREYYYLITKTLSMFYPHFCHFFDSLSICTFCTACNKNV